jgi:hypothetical protein
MKVELEIEEPRQLFVTLLDLIMDDVELGEADRAALRKWRTAMSAGSEGMRVLAAKMNSDLSRVLEDQKRSAVRKPDWR